MAADPSRARRPAAETREHVLAVAHDLFYADGIRATGVDRIVAVAGIGPTTLYRQFASKDDLVAAYVDREADAYRAWFGAVADAAGADPRERARAFLTGVGEQVAGSACRGCPFQLALAEFPAPAHPAHRAAVALKRWVRDRLIDLAGDAGAPDPVATGDHLMLLAEGSYAAASSLRSPAITARAIDAAVEALRA